ncbi:MAG: hypothetical protein ACOCV2_10025, partial [Persicimonas sp.]
DEKLPEPAWKDEFDQEDLDKARAATGGRGPAEAVADDSSVERPEPGALDGAVGGEPVPVEETSDDKAPEPADGSLETPAKDRALTLRAHHRSRLPSALRAHIEERYGDEDGTVDALSQSGAVAVVERGATVHDADEVVIEGELIKADEGSNVPLRIETGIDTFTDPSQTIFMRQLRIYGVESEEELRAQVEHLFTSFGYETIQADRERMRFERGSVTFILALVPLFVLVLPLFVYLLLYSMGRSTIQQEPVELDVQFRKLGDEEGTYEIDLTFIGMHGVVLGSADQRVLNQEVDTLQDELQWALTSQ